MCVWVLQMSPRRYFIRVRAFHYDPGRGFLPKSSLPFNPLLWTNLHKNPMPHKTCISLPQGPQKQPPR